MYVRAANSGRTQGLGDWCDYQWFAGPAGWLFCTGKRAISTAQSMPGTATDVAANAATGKITQDQAKEIAVENAQGLRRASAGKLTQQKALEIATNDVNSVVPPDKQSNPGNLVAYGFLAAMGIGGLLVATR